mmetsp:Transcript_43595/g.109350  ORF Transcript_43595/g.109350 Transcript_43595/m.109350 type:complete len:86 (-) Transcript_43595:31-288(-)
MGSSFSPPPPGEQCRVAVVAAALQRVTSQPPAGGACCAEEAPGDREGFWLGRMRLSRVGVVGVVVGVMWKDAYVRWVGLIRRPAA